MFPQLARVVVGPVGRDEFFNLADINPTPFSESGLDLLSQLREVRGV